MVCVLLPIQLTIGIVLMCHIVEFSFLAGLSVVIILSFMAYLSNIFYMNTNDRYLSRKDQRMKITMETLQQIRFIKANAW